MALFDLSKQIAGGFTLKDLRAVLKHTVFYNCESSYFEQRFAHLKLMSNKDLPSSFYNAKGGVLFSQVECFSNYLYEFSSTPDALIEALEEAKLCLKECVELGFLDETNIGFKATTKGNSLRMMSLMKRKSRAAAEKEMQAFLKRIDDLHELDMGMRVTSAYAFGSYITDSETLGDLDIAVSYQCCIEYDEYNPYEPPAYIYEKLLSLGYKQGDDWMDFTYIFAVRFLRKSRFVTTFDLSLLAEYVKKGQARARCIYFNESAEKTDTMRYLDGLNELV